MITVQNDIGAGRYRRFSHVQSPIVRLFLLFPRSFGTESLPNVSLKKSPIFLTNRIHFDQLLSQLQKAKVEQNCYTPTVCISLLLSLTCLIRNNTTPVISAVFSAIFSNFSSKQSTINTRR